MNTLQVICPKCGRQAYRTTKKCRCGYAVSSYYDGVDQQTAANRQRSIPAPKKKKGNLGCLIITATSIILFLILLANMNPATNSVSDAVNRPTDNASAASQLVKTYYDYINRKDYVDALNLWRQPGNYDNFVAEYKNIIHEDVTVSNVTPLNNGNEEVDITLIARSTSGVWKYRGYYTVGQVNGSWKLMSGHLMASTL